MESMQLEQANSVAIQNEITAKSEAKEAAGKLKGDTPP